MAFFLALIIIGLFLKLTTSNIPVPSKECRGHTWVYKNQGTDQEYMVCTKCKMLPGSDLKEEGDF